MRTIVCHILTVFFLFLPLTVYGKTMVGLQIRPENVGVFFQNQTQQFQAYAVFSDGSWVDYTKKVGWSIRSNPFSYQKLAADKVATINDNGLVTVRSSWGRVNVVATFPKPARNYVELTGPYELLLRKRCTKEYTYLCLNRRECDTVDGYWWTTGSCQPYKQPPAAIPIPLPPAIDMILMGK